MDSINAKYKPAGEDYPRYGLFKIKKTGRYCNQYSMGVAIFQMPLFLIAHAWAVFTKQDLADGYSSPYQHATVISTLLFVVMGLVLLTKFLLNYFNQLTVFATILLIDLGTNLFNYSTSDSGFSQSYLFFAYSAVL
jgi:hypothetical protein